MIFTIQKYPTLSCSDMIEINSCGNFIILSVFVGHVTHETHWTV